MIMPRKGYLSNLRNPDQIVKDNYKKNASVLCSMVVSSFRMKTLDISCLKTIKYKKFKEKRQRNKR